MVSQVSSQYSPVLDCVPYSCTIKRSWLSLWLGLAVSIFQFWIVHRTVRRTSWLSLWLGFAVSIFSLVLPTIQLGKNDVLALARVRASSQNYPV